LERISTWAHQSSEVAEGRRTFVRGPA